MARFASLFLSRFSEQAIWNYSSFVNSFFIVAYLSRVERKNAVIDEVIDTIMENKEAYRDWIVFPEF